MRAQQWGVLHSVLHSARLIRQLAELINTERQCCPFISYELELRQEAGSVVLSVRGHREAKPILDEFSQHVRALNGQAGRD